MFIDTSGWLCVMDERDRRHTSAAELFLRYRDRVTHSFVLAELVPLSQKRGFSRQRTLNFIEELIGDPTIETVWVDELLTLEANELLKRRIDKNWSLCDAVSFLLMDEMNLSEALTTDHHFEQAGFIKLLES